MLIFVQARKKLASLYDLFLNGKKKRQPQPDRPWLEQYDEAVPHDIDIPEISMHEIFRQSLRAHNKQPAVCYFGTTLTFEKLHRKIEAVAAGLEHLRIKKGDRVALILPNTPQFMIVYWAALRIGAIAAPINPMLSGREIKELLDIARPKVLVVLDSIHHNIHSHIENCGAGYIIETSAGDFMPVFTRLLFTLKNRATWHRKATLATRPLPFRVLASRLPVSSDYVQPTDTAVLLFTGGVTGTPKAVALTHRNLVANVLQTRAWLGDLKDGQETILGLLPFFHSYGMTACHHLAIQTGAKLILEPRFKTSRAISLIHKYKVTIFPGVPTMYRAIVNMLQERAKKLRHIRVCVSGGAPLPPALKETFEKWTASALIEGYGLTEAAPLTHCNPLVGKGKVGSIGLPCPNTEARILHVRKREPLPPNSLGELQVKGPQVMPGYWNNAVETRQVLSPDGWLSTGDIAKMDKDGYFYIVDRKKDMILYGGLNIYPSEVEQVLNQHPAVNESAVVGLKDDFYGEIVKAFVLLKDGAACTKKELLAFCGARLAHYKIPRQIEFVTFLPRNFLGKVVRRKLAR